jgi:hypothetical protein
LLAAWYIFIFDRIRFIFPHTNMSEVELVEPQDIVVKIDLTITEENLSSEVDNNDIADEGEEILTPLDYAEVFIVD